MQQLGSNLCFGGQQNRYKHLSAVLDCEMTFSVFLPPAALSSAAALPVLYWLSGLTCTDENFVQKAGAQRVAAELGLVVVAPDTSPRGEAVANADSYDLGQGAGFYLNATAEPWARHYQMYDYINTELPALIAEHFPIDPSRQSIFGHSMGGHGALTIALKNPEKFRSVSAFAPICAPLQCPWGQKAFSHYLGDAAAGADYDAVELIAAATRQLPMRVDQGGADEFLSEQLQPELLLAAAEAAGYPLTYACRDGYDHSYFFIASFMEDHLRFHHAYLLD